MVTNSLVPLPLHLPPNAAVWPFLMSGTLHILGAVAVLAAGFWISGRMDMFVRKAVSRSKHIDAMLGSFFGSITRYFILMITLLAVLSQFGIQTTSLVAVIGAASLAIGLALQGTLSNLAAGVMLLIFRPFRIGHHVLVAGADGTVKELTLFWTEIIDVNNVQIIVPNGSVWGQALRNFSIYDAPVATTEIRFPVAPAIDPETMRSKIAQIVAANLQVLKTPAATVFFDRAGADNVLQIVVTFAPVGAIAAPVKSDIINAVQAAMQTAPPPAS